MADDHFVMGEKLEYAYTINFKTHTMTTEQEKVLDQLEDNLIIGYLKEKRHKAFIVWSVEDVIDVAEGKGFDIDTGVAKRIIENLERHKDCEQGINWETVDAEIESFIGESSFEATIKELDTEEIRTALFCSLDTNENIEDYWNDDNYFLYGYSKEEVEEHVGKKFYERSFTVIGL